MQLTMGSQAEKGRAFRDLHFRDRAFVIPNPFDAGTARLLQISVFEALATTSAGFAFSLGMPDGAIDRAAMLEHVGSIVAAVDLPVSADLENGYGDEPERVAQTVRLAAEAGLAGCSIEDVGDRRHPLPYERHLATERIRAAADAAHALPFPFMLTARCENFLVGRRDLKDTIERLQRYQEAGADVLYAPGLTEKRDIGELVRSVDRPVNVIVGLAALKTTVDELSEIGVKRISVGSALSRAALGEFLRAAEEMRDQGTFTFADEAAKYTDLNALFERFVAAGCCAAVSACAPSGPPAPITTLGPRANQLRKAFNAGAGRVRLVLLVSPT
jgi:2-methylisocitrate lyase-like PEP mutase family enzyme